MHVCTHKKHTKEKKCERPGIMMLTRQPNPRSCLLTVIITLENRDWWISGLKANLGNTVNPRPVGLHRETLTIHIHINIFVVVVV